MPSCYAHYRFGSTLLDEIPADIRQPILRHRQLFDVGLHGPDIFFYQNPFVKGSENPLGDKLHRQNGRDFFTRVCKRLRLEPSDAGNAYLYGLLAHFCLDSACHGFINASAETENVGHTEIETEFDRFLLELDGKIPPHTQDNSGHIRLTRNEAAVAAEFYPHTTPATVQQCVRNMALYTRLLASREGPMRKTVEKTLSLVGGKLPEFLMPPAPNSRCAHLNESLLQLYGEAYARYPRMVEQVYAHLSYGAPFEEDFSFTFDG